MRDFPILLTLLVMLLATGIHAQSPTAPPPPPVAEYSVANWKEFSSVEGGFAVSMPGVPAASSEDVDTKLGRIVTHLFILETKLGEYGVSYADFPVRVDNPDVIRKILDGSRDEILASGAKLLNENDVTLDGIGGRELIVTQAGLVGRHWMFLANGKLYAVMFATPPSATFKNGNPGSNPGDRTDLYEMTCTRFFGSFKFIKRNDAALLSAQPPANDGVLEPVATKKDLYPANADAKKEIDEALKRAVIEKKRVMLIFGANWCYDCHVLDRALHEGEAGKIARESFLLVHVDIGEGDKNLDLTKLYKTPLDKGVPAVAILDRDGKVLYSSGAGEFEAARHMMKKNLVAFLSQWTQR